MYSLYLNLSLFVSQGTFTIKEHDKPNYFGQKNTERIRICVLFKFFFYISLLYFGNAIATNHFFSSCFGGNSIATNQWSHFFLPLFRQCHCHKPIGTIFFFPPTSAMPLPQFHSTNFFFFFRNDMCTQFLSDKLLLLD